MKIDDKELKKSLTEAIEISIIKKEGFKDKVRKFDESVDFIINLKDINLNDPKQRIEYHIFARKAYPYRRNRGIRAL